MKKAIVAGIVGIGLALGVGGTASAEDLYRNGANKVTITPQGAPEGAVITKAKVTVKKGKKTVARNKNFYKAKKGKYKVTSTITYFPMVTKSTAGESADTCRITGIEVISDRTSWDAAEAAEYGYAYISGQATVRYSGTCTYDPMMVDWRTSTWAPKVTFDTTWTDDEHVFTKWDGSGTRAAAIANKVATIGDVDYFIPHASMSTFPATATSYDPPVTTKSVRTVTVR